MGNGDVGHWSREPIQPEDLLDVAVGEEAERAGDLVAKRVSRRSTSGQPPMVNGARRCVQQRPAAASSRLMVVRAGEQVAGERLRIAAIVPTAIAIVRPSRG